MPKRKPPWTSTKKLLLEQKMSLNRNSVCDNTRARWHKCVAKVNRTDCLVKPSFSSLSIHHTMKYATLASQGKTFIVIRDVVKQFLLDWLSQEPFDKILKNYNSNHFKVKKATALFRRNGPMKLPVWPWRQACNLKLHKRSMKLYCLNDPKSSKQFWHENWVQGSNQRNLGKTYALCP